MAECLRSCDRVMAVRRAALAIGSPSACNACKTLGDVTTGHSSARGRSWLPQARRVAAAVAVLAFLAGAAPRGGAQVAGLPSAGHGVSLRPEPAITLITGEQVQLAGPGNGQVGVMSPGGPAGSRSLIAVGTGRTAYLIPAAALRYLGKGLSPGLFEVPALRRAERDGRLPLRFGFAGRFPALPGLRGARIVRPAGHAVTGLAIGYVAAVSAGRFWRALSRLLRAERAGAFWVTLADGAGTAGAAAVVNGAVLAGGRSQQAPAHTLTVKGTNRFGKPDNGDTVTIDGVHQNKTVALLTFRHGIARVKVPAGRYWAIGDFMDFFDVHQPVPDMRLVTRPQFTVTRNTTIRFSERAATSKVTMSTPRPAVPADTTVEITRSGRYNYFEALDDGISIWVNPTRVAPSVGRLREYSSQQLVSPPGTRGVPYAYYLSFRGPEGIIPRSTSRSTRRAWPPCTTASSRALPQLPRWKGSRYSPRRSTKHCSWTASPSGCPGGRPST